MKEDFAARLSQYQGLFLWFLIVIVAAIIVVSILYNLSRTVSRRRKMVGG